MGDWAKGNAMPPLTEVGERSRWWLAVHFFGGISMKIFSDQAGFSDFFVGLSRSSDPALLSVYKATGAVAAMAAGYLLSKSLLDVIDRYKIPKKGRFALGILLPVVYFFGAVLLALVVRPLLGASAGDLKAAPSASQSSELKPVAVGGSALSSREGSAFSKLDFDGNISIEIPRDWTLLNENLRTHLNTAGEAGTRLSGITPNPGKNVILVAASTYISSRTPSATLRLSVRHGEAPTQAAMREVSRFPKAALSELLAPVAEEARRAIIGMDGVKSVVTTDSGITTNQGVLCMFFEFETDTATGADLSQTYICPLGNRSVKLSTSYRKSEANFFRPTVEYVWRSLRVE